MEKSGQSLFSLRNGQSPVRRDPKIGSVPFFPVRVPYPVQPVMEQRPPSVPTWQSVLVECGEPFGKTLPGPGAYTATAFSLAGGFFELPDESMESWPARLTLLDTVLVSAGGGTGIECKAGGCLSGARTTSLDAYHSCLYGFDTDVKRDTSGSWEVQSIRQVSNDGDIHWAQDLSGTRLQYMTGTVEVWGYDPTVTPTQERKAYVDDIRSYALNTNTNTYANLFVVVKAPSRPVYTEVYDGAAPVITLYLTFTDSASVSRTLAICLPAGLHVSSEDQVFRVGANGETFWHGTTWPPQSLLPMSQERLASEWVEMWLRGTAFRTLSGNVSIDPAYARRSDEP